MSRHNKDYTKFSNNKPEEKIEPVQVPVEETLEEVLENIRPEVHGVVKNCSKLNVREAPYENANIVCVIDAATKLVINQEESTGDFYAVCTESGAEGYCMSQYIEILP